MSKREHCTLVRCVIWAIIVEMGLIALFFVDLIASQGLPGRNAASMFLGGDFTAAFWSVDIIAGLVIPLVLLISERARRLAPSIAAPVLLLIGGLTLRWIFVTAGQAM